MEGSMSYTLSNRGSSTSAIVSHLTGWIVILGLLAVVLFGPGPGTTKKVSGVLHSPTTVASY
jgi:hypothetical protein